MCQQRLKRIPIHRAALIAAIALAAGAAQAQSSVTLSGLLDVTDLIGLPARADATSVRKSRLRESA